MASNLRKKITASTRLECESIFNGSYWRWIANNNPERWGKNQSILNYESNTAWKKLERKLYKQVNSLKMEELLKLIATDQRECVQSGFDELLWYGEDEALRCLRHLIVESFISLELVRVAMDFTAAADLTPQQFFAYIVKSQDTRAHLERIRAKAKRLFLDFRIITPTQRCPQRSPNAPNFLPALSLAAA